MQVDNDTLMDACSLWVLCNATEPMTPEEIFGAVDELSDEEKLDALARYQEHGA